MMDFSALNPTVWLVFAGFCVVTWLAVKTFHARHPDYPGFHCDGNEDAKKLRKEVAL